MSALGGGTELAQGYALQRQGRLTEAAAMFEQVLAREPRNADALHLLGVTLGQLGRPQEAVRLIAAAVEVRPSNPYMRANLGNALGSIGRHAEAASAYERAAALKPDLLAAHRGRGHALLSVGRAEDALASFERALQLAPGAPTHNDVGVALDRLGRISEAIEHFRSAVARDPRHVEALQNLGVAELSQGRYQDALTSLNRALTLQPRHAATLANRANVLRALGQNTEALASYDQSLAIAPQNAEVHHSRALALLGLERYEDALAGLERARSLAPERFGILFHRGVALSLLERHAEALASFDAALAVEPDSADALNNRGVELGHLGRAEEALMAFAKASESRPDLIDAYNNAANVLKGLGRHQEALTQFDRALRLQPDHAPTLWSKSLLKLALGDYEEGWPLYEARLRLEYLREYRRSFSVPRWTGSEDIAGKRILIHAEQGLGDALQFCRYLPLLEAKGAQVIFEVPGALSSLMRSLHFGGRLLCQGEPLPQELDCHCPLLSLPLAFNTRAETIPADIPYLTADGAAVDAWRDRLRALPGLKIGLNWQGHSVAEKQAWIRGRSFPLACIAPLAKVPGVSLVSLQKGAAAGQRDQVEFADAIAQLTNPDDTSAEALQQTAALISALDLVITSDTSVAHLAGALGVPVWVALHSVPDWRWLLDRSDSPWYPSMRLFRQRVAGDWLELFERVALEVKGLIALPI